MLLGGEKLMKKQFPLRFEESLIRDMKHLCININTNVNGYVESLIKKDIEERKTKK